MSARGSNIALLKERLLNLLKAVNEISVSRAAELLNERKLKVMEAAFLLCKEGYASLRDEPGDMVISLESILVSSHRARITVEAPAITVVTAPPNILQELYRSNVTFVDTITVFRTLITEAEWEIFACFPFLQPTCISSLEPELYHACGRGVRFKLLTRPANEKASKAISMLTSIYRANPDLMLIRYFKPDDPRSQLHAKLLICDREKAYIGSANLNSRSVCSNFELGVVVRDKQIVDSLVKILDKVWENAEVSST